MSADPQFAKAAKEAGLDPEEALRAIQEARTNSFTPPSEAFQALYDECCLESLLRQHELLAKNPGAWNVNLAVEKPQLNLANLGDFDMQILGTSTPVDFLMADEGHPSATVFGSTMGLVADMRKTWEATASLPELNATCISLHHLPENLFGHQLSAIASVLYSDSACYYRGPSGPSSVWMVLTAGSGLRDPSLCGTQEYIINNIRKEFLILTTQDAGFAPRHPQTALVACLKRRGVLFEEAAASAEDIPADNTAPTEGWRVVKAFAQEGGPAGLTVIFDDLGRMRHMSATLAAGSWDTPQGG